MELFILMKRSTRPFSFVLRLFFSCFVLIASLEATELYETKRIAQIDVVVCSPDADVYFDPHPILAKLHTKEGDPFDQSTFDADLKTLAEEYDRVEPSVRLKEGEVVIFLRLKPRPIIHAISWQGNEHISKDKLQKELDIQPYTPFHRQEFNKAFKKVKELYIKESYFESVLTYSLSPISGTNQVDIIIDIQEGRSGIVQEICFHGFTPEEKSDLTDMMYLKKYNFLTSWLTGNGYLQDEMLEQDRMTLVNYLHNKGYADARIDIVLIEDPSTGRMIVDLTAHRGPLYHFGNVTLAGNTLLSSEEILKVSLVHEGETFSADKIRDTAQAIKDLYGHKGYIDASVQFETQVKEDAPLFDIEFLIAEGEQYRIGLIHIFGNHATRNNVILRESLLVPGETFDARKLRATQMRLEAMGYFKCVNVYAVRTVEDEGLGKSYRDVYIEVEEKTTGSINLFMGFSSMENVYGGLELSEHNFDIRGLGRALTGHPSALRGGGEFFHMRATVGKKETNYLISWMNPYLNDSLWRFGFELSKTFSKLQAGQRIRTYGGSVFTNYPLSHYWTFGMRQRCRHSNNKITSSVQQDTTQQETNQLEQHGLISAFSLNLNYDSTDSARKPHRGWRSYTETELAGFGGSYTFAKFSYLNSIYFPVWTKGTFKLRGEFKYILPFWKSPHQINIPLSERLFLGGETSVRGYKPYSLGSAIGTSDSPLGGISSSLLSMEYNQAVLSMADLFFFFDAGSVSTHRFDINTMNTSIGIGTRLDIGHQLPIVLGYGYPINPDRNEQVQGFFFSMAGQF